MPDLRFFRPDGPFTVAQLAEAAGAEPVNCPDRERPFGNVAPLDEAGADDVSFLDNRLYAAAFEQTRAGCCIVAPEMVDRGPAGTVLLVTAEPYLAYARVATAFHPRTEESYVPLSASERIHPSAEIGEGYAISFQIGHETLRATLPGQYRVRPAHAEEMYFPEVFGRSDGGVFTVTE